MHVCMCQGQGTQRTQEEEEGHDDQHGEYLGAEDAQVVADVEHHQLKIVMFVLEQIRC